MKPLKSGEVKHKIYTVMVEDILIPIFICVVLPVMIVWLITRARQNETNRKTEVMLKAIDAGATIDADFFRNPKESITIKERLLKRLTGGCIFTLMGIAFVILGLVNKYTMSDIYISPDSFTVPVIFGGIFLAIGVALLVVFVVGRKMFAKEIEAEEKALEKK